MNSYKHFLAMTTAAGCMLAACTLTFAAEQKYGGIVIDAEDVKLDTREYSPHLDRIYPQRVFWGDTHLHTAYSTDTGMIGNRLGPDAAYRFARGEEVVSSSGV